MEDRRTPQDAVDFRASNAMTSSGLEADGAIRTGAESVQRREARITMPESMPRTERGGTVFSALEARQIRADAIRARGNKR